MSKYLSFLVMITKMSLGSIFIDLPQNWSLPRYVVCDLSYLYNTVSAALHLLVYLCIMTKFIDVYMCFRNVLQCHLMTNGRIIINYYIVLIECPPFLSFLNEVLIRTMTSFPIYIFLFGNSTQNSHMKVHEENISWFVIKPSRYRNSGLFSVCSMVLGLILKFL